MKKRSTPDKLDNDNPEWTAADIKRANSFAGLPASLLTKLRGRPTRISFRCL